MNISTDPAPSDSFSENWKVYFSLMVCMYTWIILVNSLTLVTIGHHKQLQTKPFLLVGSLAVVDLLVGVENLATALMFVCTFLGSLQVNLDKALVICAGVLAMWISPIMNSFYHLVLVAVDRYIAVLHPFKYEELVTTRRLKLLIGASWFLSFSQGFAVFGWANHLDPVCSLVIMDTPASYFFPFLSVPALSCTMALIVLYCRVFMVARAQLIKISNEGTTSNISSAPHNRVKNKQEVRGKLKLIKMFALLVGVFLVCILPITLMSTVGHMIGTETIIELRDFPTLITCVTALMTMNSGMNFVVYVTQDKTFRETLIALICRKKSIG